jgi:hypothetical protein
MGILRELWERQRVLVRRIQEPPVRGMPPETLREINAVAPRSIPLTLHRRALEVVRMERDRLWLKKLQVVERQIMFPFHAPITTLIRATEQELEQKEKSLEPAPQEGD